jgi:hypothetical protein
MKPLKTMFAMAALLGVCVIGSALAGDGDKRSKYGGKTVWAESVKTLNLDAAGLEAVAVKTHNGAINYDGNTDGASQIEITVTMKGGGPDEATAEEALAAIDVFAELDNGTADIGWRWSTKKEKKWRAQVSFDIQGPATVDLNARTHNGTINAQNLDGAVTVEAHNGKITVASGGGKLDVETHNGEINADYDGDEVRLKTHNGRIAADLTRCGAVTGDLETHNGEVVITVGDATSTDLTCNVHNGAISDDAALQNVKKSKRRLTATIGSGDGSLAVKAHNGSVRIKRAEG